MCGAHRYSDVIYLLLINIMMEGEEKVYVKYALDPKIRDKQERIVALLTPFESYILLFERILVWELPYASVALIVSVHMLFW